MDFDGHRFLLDTIFASVLFIVAIGGSYVPRYLMLRKGAQGSGGRGLLFQLGSLFSGGVMLSAGLCHLLDKALPEIRSKVEHFPLGTFLCAAGYLVTLTADEIGNSVSGNNHHGHDHHDPTLPLICCEEQSSLSNNGQNDGESIGARHITIDISKIINSGQISIGEICIHHNKSKPLRVSFITAMLLGIALSLHSVLEGVALGSQEDLSSARDIMLAIFCHKGLAGYALGASLMDSQTSSRKYWSIILGFSIATPAGILIGYGISEFASGMISASVSAVASGTFLYVATMEVIPKELADPAHKAKKIGALLLGFASISILSLWA